MFVIIETVVLRISARGRFVIKEALALAISVVCMLMIKRGSGSFNFSEWDVCD